MKTNTILFVVFTVCYFIVWYSIYPLILSVPLQLGFLTVTAWACGLVFSDMMNEVFGPKRWRF